MRAMVRYQRYQSESRRTGHHPLPAICRWVSEAQQGRIRAS